MSLSKLIIANATADQNRIVEISVQAAVEDEEYKVQTLSLPRHTETYTGAGGDTPTDVAAALATGLNGVTGLTASNTDEVISLEIENLRNPEIFVGKRLILTETQPLTKAVPVTLGALRGKPEVAVGGTHELTANLAILNPDILDTLRGQEAAGLIDLTVVPLDNGGVVKGNRAVVADEEMNGLVIKGNVDVSGGVTLTAVGTTIEGNLTVDATSSVDFTNVVVLGDVTLTTGAGTTSWKGGSFFGTLTDPDGDFGAQVAGDYLTV